MAEITILVGTVFGGTEQVSVALKNKLTDENHQVKILASPSIKDVLESQNLIICTSTTGSGDIPEELAVLYYELNDQFPLLPNKTFSVLGLGDSSYGETFCGAGKKFEQLFEELTAKRLTELFCIDAMETFSPEVDALKWIEIYLTQLSQLKLEE